MNGTIHTRAQFGCPYAHPHLGDVMDGPLAESTNVATRCVTAKTVADFLHVTPATLKRMVARGEFPAPLGYVAGNRPRWSMAQLNAYWPATPAQ